MKTRLRILTIFCILVSRFAYSQPEVFNIIKPNENQTFGSAFSITQDSDGFM